MNDAIGNGRDHPFDESRSESDGSSDNDNVEEDYLIAERRDRICRRKKEGKGKNG